MSSRMVLGSAGLLSLVLCGCEVEQQSYAETLEAHGSGHSGSALLDVAAKIELDPVYCSSPNLERRRPHYDCDGPSWLHHGHRGTAPFMIDASVDDVELITFEYRVTARKKHGGW